MSLGPTILPGDWTEVSAPSWYREMMDVSIASYIRNDGQLKVLMTEEPHEGTKWLHVSVSHPERYPTWDEIHFVKDLFIGKDKDAVMILPEEKYYVNLHKNCFHLYHRLDGDTVPGNPQRD
jgi:hypothetical protein